MQLARLIGPELLSLMNERPDEILELLDEIHPEDMAELVAELDDTEAIKLVSTLPSTYAADVFSRLDEDRQARLTELLGADSIVRIARAMPADDRTDLFSILPPTVGEPLLEELERVDPQAAKVVEQLARWPPKTAGSLMTTEYVGVRPDHTLARTIAEIRAKAKQVQLAGGIYVVDDQRHLLGTLTLSQLLLSAPEELVDNVMDGHIISVEPELNQEEVAKILAKYDLQGLPVADAHGTMLGVITSDDVLDVIAEEQAEDVQKMGGMEALGAPYLKVPFARMVRKRAGWLAALFLGEMLTATAMARYEGEIARAVVLALFVPLIISSGGNSGSQASTLVIRALALDEVRLRDVLLVIRRELAAGLVLGAVLGGIGFLRIVIWEKLHPTYGPHYFLIALTVCASLIGIVTFGTLAGSILPFVLRKLGFDPASASAPFVATLVDVTGLVIYFTIASIILRGTLL